MSVVSCEGVGTTEVRATPAQGPQLTVSLVILSV